MNQESIGVAPTYKQLIEIWHSSDRARETAEMSLTIGSTPIPESCQLFLDSWYRFARFVSDNPLEAKPLSEAVLQLPDRESFEFLSDKDRDALKESLGKMLDIRDDLYYDLPDAPLPPYSALLKQSEWLRRALTKERARIRREFGKGLSKREKTLSSSLLVILILLACFGGWHSVRETRRHKMVYIPILQTWGTMRVNRSVKRNPLTINGQVFKKGVGTHANSKIRVKFKPGFKFLTGAYGIDDETKGKGSVVFRIFGGAKLLLKSPVIRGGDAPKKFRVPVSGLTDVVLMANAAKDGNKGDHADWVNLKLWE